MQAKKSVKVHECKCGQAFLSPYQLKKHVCGVIASGYVNRDAALEAIRAGRRALV